MMVVFVSQCEKNALKKTRRVLDSFADRIGDNTWQTIITQEGLEAVQKLLRKTASKSTAVSCHWYRSRERSDLLWVVGNKKKFGYGGVVPVNRTESDLLGEHYENTWQYLPVIKSLVALAALFHDWGKASELFQNKLSGKLKVKGDPLRHEWISSLLFSAFVKSSGEGDQWIDSLVDGNIDESLLKEKIVNQEKKPLSDLPDSASLLIWLIVSHHRLPLPAEEKKANGMKKYSNNSIQALLKKVTEEWGYQNRHDETEYKNLVKRCFEFPCGLLSNSEAWMKSIRYWATVLQQHFPQIHEAMSTGAWRVILHHARLCLMLGDHYYSSQNNDPEWETTLELYANTDQTSESRRLKQKLDEHLVRVAETGVNIVNLLPFFESEPIRAEGIKALRPSKSSKGRFGWQDKAVTGIRRWRTENNQDEHGFFAINMASTGCGKTFANAKVMQALSEGGDSLRYVLALGLRTLTLQTGDEYRERIGLTDDELAVLIGSRAVAELHSGSPVLKEDEVSAFEQSGSESQESLLDPTENLHWNDEEWQDVLPEEELTTVLRSKKDRQLLYSPILVCTIDHIMAATEARRGGRYILPSLRLMSSDLVIDEIDDFSGEDLIAIGRLIHLAGMLGRKVMLSSATIQPDLALGFFNCYQHGWKLFAASRGLSKSIGCAWIDEFKTVTKSLSCSSESITDYEKSHNQFIVARAKKLVAEPVRRKAEIVECKDNDSAANTKDTYSEIIQNAIVNKHKSHNVQDIATGISVSFGVVRTANIKLCIEVTRYLLATDWPSDIEVRCMPYHSQQVMLLRHQQEQHLDTVLKRKEAKDEEPVAFSDPIIRGHLSNCTAKNLIFVLVATPVEEVGRDHDFDWAVVEPSSYRSIIQLAGRVRRHRVGEVDSPNIALLQYNWKGYEGNADRVFNRPGYETSSKYQLSTHDLKELVSERDLAQAVTAIPCIQKPDSLSPKDKLADLEHFSTAQTLCQFDQPQCHSMQGYLTDYWWMTALPQYFCRFRRSSPSTVLAYVATEHGYEFQEYDSQNRRWVSVGKSLGIREKELTDMENGRLWLRRNYSELLKEWSERQDLSEQQASRRFGEVSFIDWGANDNYEYNDQFGLVRVN